MLQYCGADYIQNAQTASTLYLVLFTCHRDPGFLASKALACCDKVSLASTHLPEGTTAHMLGIASLQQFNLLGRPGLGSTLHPFQVLAAGKAL